MFVPGRQGGVDEAARYIVENSSESTWDRRLVVTSGDALWAAPIVFTRAIAAVLFARFRNRKFVGHLNMSSRGSALRKSLLAATLLATRTPYVIQVHGGGFEQFLANLPRPLKRYLAFIFRHADRTVVLGERFADIIHSQLQVRRGQIEVIPNGVKGPPEITRSPAPPSDSVPRIVHLGRLHPSKGTFDLLEALRTEPLKSSNWTAVFAGNDQNEEVQRAVESAGQTNRILVLPWQDRNGVSRLLDEADIFVLPSHAEAMSLALLESMAFGVACVTTDVGAHSEVITNDVNGKVLPAGDPLALERALFELIASAELRTRLGSAARESFRTRFDIHEVVRRWDLLYDRINE